MKINGVDHNNWLYPWLKPGNTSPTLKLRILRDNGKVDAFHARAAALFHPVTITIFHYAADVGDGTLSGVEWCFPIIWFRRFLGWLFRRYWIYRRGPIIEGINAAYARAIKKHFKDKGDEIPVLCTGGFQHASVIGQLIREEWCDGVTMARPLIANNHLPQILMEKNGPDPGQECTYCNKCLVNDIENPLGCYELSR
jgi:2,4-dienoyl-CoA reductase (NADPH2)